MRLTRALIGLVAAAAMALAPSLALAVTQNAAINYPFSNPTYIPTALLSPALTATAPGEIIFPVSGVNTVTVRVVLSAGSIAGNLQGTNNPLSGTPVWTNLPMVPIAGGSIVTSFAAAGFWAVNTAGLSGVRVHITTLSGGTGTFSMAGSLAPNGTTILNPAAVASGTVQVDQTTPGTTNGVALVGVNGATALAGNGVTGTGSARVTVASDNTPFPIKIDQTTPGTTNKVAANLVAGSALIGSAGIDQTTPGTTNAVVGTLVATGGSSLAHVISAATNNSQLIGTAAAHSLYQVVVLSSNATAAFLKFYNKGTAPTCASDTVLYTVPIIQNVPMNINFGPAGAAFSLGIGICIVALVADNDNTSATTGITVSASYK